MAIRRLNFTGRKRLNQADVQCTVYESRNGAAMFDAVIDLKEYKLPEDALVFVEAQRQTSFMRFPFGTVGELSPPEKRSLDEFDTPDGILFRVKVTTQGEQKGLLLAEADRIPPRRPEEAEDKRIPLLSVKPDENLGDQVFQVDFSDQPILLLNVKVGNWRTVAKDPLFISLVYPAIMREILTRILRIDEVFHTDDPEDWRSQWLRLATLLPGVPKLPEAGNEDGIDDWIDEAVACFCRNFQMMNKFTEYWTAEAAS